MVENNTKSQILVGNPLAYSFSRSATYCQSLLSHPRIAAKLTDCAEASVVMSFMIVKVFVAVSIISAMVPAMLALND